jgi:thymidylate synthase
MHSDYSGQGVDQLAECVRKIRESPEDRRIILSAWNPVDLPLMALPPCHLLCQFFVSPCKKELSCQMYQRSADMGLGVPFNIASYALLTVLVAQVCGLEPGDFVHTIGDAHVYLNHVEALQEQLKRTPKPFPKLFVDPNVKELDDFRFEHFTLEGYDPEPTIKMKMAV